MSDKQYYWLIGVVMAIVIVIDLLQAAFVYHNMWCALAECRIVQVQR